MVEESKLRADIIAFLTGNLSLDDFEDRFIAMSWNMHQDSSDSAIALASAVELRLAEHSSGHLPEAEMRAELAKLVSGVIIVSVYEHARASAAGASSSSFTELVWQQMQPADIRREEALA